MKTLRKLIYRDIFSAVGFVALAFLAMFFSSICSMKWATWAATTAV